MECKRTFTMNWDGLADADDDDPFFESYERISSAVPFDLASSDEEDDDFEDSRMSFASAVSSVTVHHRSNDDFQNFATSAAGSMSPDYDIWMMAPSSISERRKRLMQEMGLSKEKELVSFKRPVSNNVRNSDDINDNDYNIHQVSAQKDSHGKVGEENKKEIAQSPARTRQHGSLANDNSPVPVLIVRSRSEGDIESLSIDEKRKEKMIGSISKQRLTRTSSMVFAPYAKIYPYHESVRVAAKEAGNVGSDHNNGGLTLNLSSENRLGAFFLIKNLDTGKEFIVNEYNEDGMWNRLSDLQTGKQLTMEEFEKSVGHSPVVKELMRRENVMSRMNDQYRKFSANSYLSKSLRMSKRRGAALLKNLKGVAHSMSLRGEREREHNQHHQHQAMVAEQKQSKISSNNKWVKVRHTGKSHKELSALYLCQEIQAHEGSIWTIKFASDTRFLASAGEDRIIHVWEVQECEVMNMNDGNLTPLHPSLCNSQDKTCTVEGSPNPSEKKKKGKGSSSPDYVHVPETVFSLSERPFCSFQGHLDDVLDLSWSRSQLLLSSSMDKTVRLWDMETKSCLKLFAHNDYVTCIQFNPMDNDYFISGSLDAKVRIWSIPDRHVVDWTDLHEMVTAACYTPDGQNALIGSHKGSCRMYSIEDSKLVQKNQIDFQTKKKSSTKKITGFQFSPSNQSEILVTSADSRIRILEGFDIVHKVRGFRNTSSQISAAFSTDGKYIVSASEDSQVYVWKREEPRNATRGKRNIITTRAHELFQCKDVSVAIPWPGKVKGEPPPMPVHSKRHARRIGSQSTSAAGSPIKEDSPAGLSKRLLPPLPKKNNKVERVQTPPEEDLAQVSRDPGIGELFNSSSSTIRDGDSPSMFGGSDLNSYSTRQDDPASISAEKDKNSSSFSSWSSWFDGSNHSSHAVQTTAWGLVIVTATLGGEIRCYQNFGIPRRLGRM